MMGWPEIITESGVRNPGAEVDSWWDASWCGEGKRARRGHGGDHFRYFQPFRGGRDGVTMEVLQDELCVLSAALS